MRYIYLIIAAIAMVGLKIFIRHINKKRDQSFTSSNIINYNKQEKIIGLVLSIILISVMIFLVIIYEEKTDAMLASSLIFGPLFIATSILTLYAVNWRVEVLEYELIYVNFLGFKKKYMLKGLEIKYSNSNYKIYKLNKRILTVSDLCDNNMILANELIKINAKVRL